MVEEFRVRSVGPSTAIYGVVGTHVARSLSPAMHNAAFAAAGCDAVYVPFCAAGFDDFAAFARAMGVTGASVTIPFKQDALAAAGQADALTRRVGAANTLRATAAGGWEATNTDVAGCVEPLAAAYRVSLAGARVSVLGAGGAARAAVVALADARAVVTVHARRRDQSELVARELGVKTGPWPPVAGSWDILINATPLGGASASDATPLPGGPFDGRLVYDLVYRQGESPLLRDARLAGVATLDGLPMLVAQAERQFAWWTGKAPSPGLMRRAADRAAVRTVPAMAGQD
jgi:shikimate dehydrogenase